MFVPDRSVMRGAGSPAATGNRRDVRVRPADRPARGQSPGPGASSRARNAARSRSPQLDRLAEKFCNRRPGFWRQGPCLVGVLIHALTESW